MRRLAIVLVGAAVILSACGGGKAAPTNLSSVNTTPADSGLSPAANGFSFANFGSNASREIFDAGDVVAMFGGSACVDGRVDPCTLTTEAAAWARMVNETRAVGHCEGLVVQASERFSLKATPLTSALKRSPELDHAIIRAFATQFLPEVEDATRVWAKKSLGDLVNELVSVLSKGATPYVLGVTSEQGGHGVLPYAIDFPKENLAVVKVYDSNWPLMERYVVIDLAADKWYFSFSGRDPQADTCAWTGGAGQITLTPMEARKTATCPFCGKKTTVTRNLLVIRSASTGWSVSTDSGVYTASSTGTEDVSGHAVRTGTCGADNTVPEFVLSTETSDFEIVLPDESSVYVSNGTSVVHVRTKGSGKRKPVKFTESTVQMDDTTTTLTVASDNLAAVVDVPVANVRLEEQKIVVNVSNNGKQEEVTVTPQEPSRRIEIERGAVATSDATKETSSVTSTDSAAVITPVVTTTTTVAGKPAVTTTAPVVTVPAITPAVTTSAPSATQTATTVQSNTSVNSPAATNSVATTVAGTSPPSTTTPTTTSSSSTSTTTTTLFVPTIKLSIPNGEGGGSGATVDSWGSITWIDPADPTDQTYDSADCGPGKASMCHNFEFRPTTGWRVLVDWNLYESVYLYKFKCPGDTNWNYPYKAGLRWFMRCDFTSATNATISIVRQ